jgi:dienelactone hydrolase
LGHTAGMQGRRRSFRWSVATAVVVATGIVAAGCGGSSADKADDGATTTTIGVNVPAADGGPSTAAFREAGPFAVGITSLALADGTKVTVWYPALKGSTAGLPAASYNQLDLLPPKVAAAVPGRLPAGVPTSNLVVPMPLTFGDVPGAADGPFPLVLFSHGLGSSRLDASTLLRGVASWGFVVAAPEHVERDRAAMLTDPRLTADATDDRSRRAAAKLTNENTVVDIRTLLDTIPLVGSAGGPLKGLADTKLVGAIGHAAGGRAVLTALSLPQIDVAVGWAATGRGTIKTVHKPSLNIAAQSDVLMSANATAKIYDDLLSPKRLVVIKGAGHNTFTDSCIAVRGGNDLVGLAPQVGLRIPPGLLAAGRDGCAPTSLDLGVAYQIIQNFTVAELREGLGLDDSGTGLGKGVTTAFAPVKLQYETDLG